jgi:hypothetical protein
LHRWLPIPHFARTENIQKYSTRSTYYRSYMNTMKISISQKIYSAFYLLVLRVTRGPTRPYIRIRSLSSLGPRRSPPEAGGLTDRVNLVSGCGPAPGSAFCCMGQGSGGCRPAEGTRADVTPAGSVADYPGNSRSIFGSSFC